MTKATIYHNPRCSKSRQTLALLREHGIEPDVHEYLKEPLDESTVRDLVNKLGVEPRTMMRRGEAPYKELALGDDARTEAELIHAMVEHPILIERPIVVTEKGAALGRPPESVLDIL